MHPKKRATIFLSYGPTGNDRYNDSVLMFYILSDTQGTDLTFAIFMIFVPSNQTAQVCSHLAYPVDTHIQCMYCSSNTSRKPILQLAQLFLVVVGKSPGLLFDLR